MKGLAITKHARLAMAMRRVTLAEVREVVQDYEVSECHRDRQHREARRFVKGDLVVVVRETTHVNVVLTILWRRPEQWTSADMVANRVPLTRREQSG